MLLSWKIQKANMNFQQIQRYCQSKLKTLLCVIWQARLRGLPFVCKSSLIATLTDSNIEGTIDPTQPETNRYCPVVDLDSIQSEEKHVFACGRPVMLQAYAISGYRGWYQFQLLDASRWDIYHRKTTGEYKHTASPAVSCTSGHKDLQKAGMRIPSYCIFLALTTFLAPSLF